MRITGLFLAVLTLFSACRLPGLPETAMAGLSAQSDDQLRQVGISLMMYAAEAGDDFYPPLAAKPGLLMFHPATLYPEYLSDPSVLLQPGSEAHEGEVPPLDQITDRHYIYLGYAIPDVYAMRVLADTYTAQMQDGGFEHEPILEGEPRVYRLRQGIGRYLAADPLDRVEVARVSDTLPVMLERRDLWPDQSVSVLYFDGRVERVPVGLFPNTEAFWSEIARMDAAAEE